MTQKYNISLPIIMGVVNATPDSFSDGGKFLNVEDAVRRGLKLAEEGAGILDIGGESTRPGAQPVSLEEELARVLPVIERLADAVDSRISIDTRKPDVASAAVRAGADIWNDVTALTFTPESLETAHSLGCDVILMHAQGDPRTMQQNPTYENVVEEVRSFLASRVEACRGAGISPEKLTIDPGIGFGKTVAHNLALISRLDRFTDIAPVLLGASRKRFIGAVDREGPADERIGGSVAAALAGAECGAAILRVHDVAATRQALNVWRAVRQARTAL